MITSLLECPYCKELSSQDTTGHYEGDKEYICKECGSTFIVTATAEITYQEELIDKEKYEIHS